MILIPIISIPKSGTHLVREIFIQAYPPEKRALRLAWWMRVDKSKILLGEKFGSEADRKANEEYLMDLKNWKSYFPDGKGKEVCISPSHMMHDKSTVRYFRDHQDEVKPIFVYRDLRDVLVSFLRGYMSGRFGADPRVVDYLNKARTIEDKYVTLLQHGIGNRNYGGFRGEVQTWLKWRKSHPVLAVSYEDLMSNNSDTICALAYHVGMDTQKMYDVLQRAKAFKTPTYRVAQTGQWKEAFSDKVRVMAKAAVGDILIELGYEKDDVW